MVMLSAAMWGLSGVCGQFLFEKYHPDPVWLIAVRQVAAGLLFLLYMMIKREPLFAIGMACIMITVVMLAVKKKT